MSTTLDAPVTTASQDEVRTRRRFSAVDVAAIAVLAHVLDDTVLHREAGVPFSQRWPATVAWVMLIAVVVVTARRARAGLFAAAAAAVGVLAAVHGALHVLHVIVDEPTLRDATGAAAAAAGLALVALAALRLRVSRRRTGALWLRWGRRGATAVVAAGFGMLVLAPVGMAIVLTHKHLEPIGDPPSAAYEEVTFRSSDGLRLTGWYVASRNRAAVMVLHGANGDRTGSLQQARLLVDHGYGVLVYDSRGRGHSEGGQNGLGWQWTNDVAGALDFLQSRPDVDPGRIGAIGLSTGADVLLEAAPRMRGISVVVADGATMRSFADMRGHADPITAASLGLVDVTTRVLTGTSPGRPLRELAAEVAPTPLLLIASGLQRGEREANLSYATAAGPTAELWDARDVHHVAAIRERPAEYERRVIGLLNRVLLR